MSENTDLQDIILDLEEHWGKAAEILDRVTLLNLARSLGSEIIKIHTTPEYIDPVVETFHSKNLKISFLEGIRDIIDTPECAYPDLADNLRPYVRRTLDALSATPA